MFAEIVEPHLDMMNSTLGEKKMEKICPKCKDSTYQTIIKRHLYTVKSMMLTIRCGSCLHLYNMEVNY